jgi:polo-like kinase 1
MTTSNPNGSSKNLVKNTADLKGSSTKINTAGLSMASKPINVVSLGKQAPSEIYVKKWVDYSSKYGLGYLLSNGASGVFFNDCTKVIMNPSKEYFEYIERRSSDRVDVVSCYTMKSYPKELQKKITLLQHFRSYLEGVKTAISNYDENAEQYKSGELQNIYLKKWMKTRHAIMFRLSNKIVQVDFQDKTQIVLSSESKLVTYVNKKGETSQYPIATALDSDNAEMAKRLKYTKDILTHMLNNNQNAAELR